MSKCLSFLTFVPPPTPPHWLRWGSIRPGWPRGFGVDGIQISICVPELVSPDCFPLHYPLKAVILVPTSRSMGCRAECRERAADIGARTFLYICSISAHMSASYREKIWCQTSITIKGDGRLFTTCHLPKGLAKISLFKELNREINKIAFTLAFTLLQMNNTTKWKREQT